MSKLRIAVDVLLQAWHRGHGAPPMGSTVYHGLRDVEMATMEGEWTRASVALPKVDSMGTSGLVLVWDGVAVWVAYVERWAEDDGWQWRQAGRDSYELDGVTHWQPLPDRPRGT